MSACLLKAASCRRWLGFFLHLPVLLLLSGADRLHVITWQNDPFPRSPHPPAILSSQLKLFAPVDHLLMPTHIIWGLILFVLFSPSACNESTNSEFCRSTRMIVILIAAWEIFMSTFLRVLLEIYSSALSRQWESLFCTQLFCCFRERLCKCHGRASFFSWFEMNFCSVWL